MVPMKRRICEVLPGNIAVLSKTKVSVAKKDGENNDWQGISISATQIGLQKQSSGLEVTSH